MINSSERSSDTSALPVLKRVFPFRLGTTSYILPAAIQHNIRFLGPCLDEVELVLFESGGEDNLPSTGEIQEMVRVAHELDFSYNVHLPTDLFFGDPDPLVRKQACLTALRFYRRTLPLEPTTYVLHLDRRGTDGRGIQDRESLLNWLSESLETLVEHGMDPSLAAVENLDYPLEWIGPMVEAMGMTFCLDIGHILIYGFDLEKYFENYLDKTTMIHLHGILDGKDHRGLEGISKEDWEVILRALHDFKGGVSLEVFSLEDLRSSMQGMQEFASRSRLKRAAPYQEKIPHPISL